MGHYSRLVTFFPDPRNYAEDIVLHLPFITNHFIAYLKSLLSHSSRRSVENILPQYAEKPPRWQSGGILEKMLIAMREKLWQPRIAAFMREIDFFEFDLYCFETGMDFDTDARTVRALKKQQKKIVVLYTGSDLRTRGIHPEVDDAADFLASFELDHLLLHPNLVHLPFPFDTKEYTFRLPEAGEKIRIGHAPTNRAAKGSAAILTALETLRCKRKIEIVLIENLPHTAALKLKSSCDIFIDQIGELGYGINSLEALALGIPTCTCLAPGFNQHFSAHPFVEIDAENLAEKVLQLIDEPKLRRALAQKGRAWVEKHHDSRVVVRRIHRAVSALL